MRRVSLSSPDSEQNPLRLDVAHVDLRWMKFGLCNDGTAQHVPLFFTHECQYNSCHPMTPRSRPRCDTDEAVWHAKFICMECPVLAQCRWWATATPSQSEGVAGGLTKTERIYLRKRLVKHDPWTTILTGEH